MVPCSRSLCRRTWGQREAPNLATCGARGCSGNLVVCWSYRGLHDNIRPPGFRLLDVLFPRLLKVWFHFPVMVERKLTNPSQLENFHVLDSRISVLHRGSSCDLVVFFAHAHGSGPAAMSWSCMCHCRPNRPIMDSGVRRRQRQWVAG